MTDIHQRLAQDHERLDRLCAELAAIVATAQKSPQQGLADFGDAFGDFESGLLAHFEGEEKYLFPLLQEEFPEEVLALREEHELIRRQVAELAEALESGDRSQPELGQRLVATLKRHSRREDGMLYSLVSQSSSNDTYQTLIGYLEQTYSKLRGLS